jgi:hypothetical protein
MSGPEMEFGYLELDDSGHWYWIPESEIDGWEILEEWVANLEEHSAEWYLGIEKVNERFAQYRLPGGPAGMGFARMTGEG